MLLKQPIKKVTVVSIWILCIIVVFCIPLFKERITVVFSKDSLHIDNKDVAPWQTSESHDNNNNETLQLWEKFKKEIREEMKSFEHLLASKFNSHNCSICSQKAHPVLENQNQATKFAGKNPKENESKSQGENILGLSTLLYQPILNLFHTTYEINDPKTHCSHNKTDVLIAVPSAPGNFKRREDVRKGNQAVYVKDPRNRAKLLFFLGSPDPESTDFQTVQDKIDTEHEQYGDIIQATFIDSYKNVTKKAALMLHWGSTFCQEANFLIRTDDDVGVKTAALVEATKRRGLTSNHFILGKLRAKDFPEKNINSRWNKYYVPDPQWPSGKQYPPFVLGGAYALPIKTAGLLLEMMRRTNFLWLDDVFVTGVCAQRLGVPVFHDKAFVFEHNGKAAN